MSDNLEDDQEIKFFQEYLQMPSVHPNPNYENCVSFLKKQADLLDLPLKVYYPVNMENPVVVMTWEGLNPDLPSILLNSHMDVVPVYPEEWSHPPFAAEIDEKGRIFARGTQDMKCVGMQYLAAIRALKRAKARFRRTIHISFVPDEEMGGTLGMRAFVQTNDFQNLNVGFALDEGMASPIEEMPVFYAERSVWRVYFHISGTAGHGSLLLSNTAGEKMQYILNKMMDLRLEQSRRLTEDSNLTIGDVTSVNLTKTHGGVQSNVVPSHLMICFDIRLALDVDHDDFEAMLNQWCEEAGGGIKLEYEQKRPRVEPTKLNECNIYWTAFEQAINNLNLRIVKRVFPGGTDSRYIRQLGIPALGFSPMNYTPILLHDHDEFLSSEIYLRGIKIYEKIISSLANL